jgi:hypothetical protein
LAVAGSLQEQMPRGDAGQVLPDPLALFLDDRDDLAIDEDVVRRDIDLALGVVEAGDLLALGGVERLVGDRGQAVEQAGADLAGSAAGQNLQQDHAHGLRVVEAAGSDPPPVAPRDQHLLVAAEPEQGQSRRDLRERMVIDVVLVGEFPPVRDAGDLAEPAGRVRIGDAGPRVRSEDLTGLGGVGGDEPEQLGDRPQVVVDQAGMDRPLGEPLLGPAGEPVGRVGGPAAEGGGLLDRLSGIGEDIARVGGGCGQPPVEADQTAHPLLADRRPAQDAGLQLGAEIPLHRIPQPRIADLGG